MSIFRNRASLRAIAMILPLLTMASPPLDAAEGQREKAEKPAETRQSTQPESPPRQSGGSGRNFVPKEKISAGKPVSFPTDI